MNAYEALRHAVRAHAGQTDLCGKPYILHPVAVAQILETDEKSGVTFDENDFVVALLHDVWEDTDYVIGAHNFEPAQWDGLTAITKMSNETYFEYIGRVCENGSACYVKLADLWHNMSPERANCLEPGARKGLEKRYLKARGLIWSAIDEEWWPDG